MNVELINPFITASSEVINQKTGLQIQVGKVYRKCTPYPSDNVVVLIGLTGNIYGNVTINLSNELACRIASAMMGGMPVPSLDEMAKSAIAELSNMIIGNTGVLLSKKSINVNVTPPTILTGDKIELSTHNAKIICIPLLFADEQVIELNISYEEKAA